MLVPCSQTPRSGGVSKVLAQQKLSPRFTERFLSQVVLGSSIHSTCALMPEVLVSTCRGILQPGFFILRLSSMIQRLDVSEMTDQQIDIIERGNSHSPAGK